MCAQDEPSTSGNCKRSNRRRPPRRPAVTLRTSCVARMEPPGPGAWRTDQLLMAAPETLGLLTLLAPIRLIGEEAIQLLVQFAPEHITGCLFQELRTDIPQGHRINLRVLQRSTNRQGNGPVTQGRA